MLRSTTVLVALALLSGLAAGQEKIKLKGGQVVSGRATKYDPAKQVLSFRTEDGKEKDYTMDQLDSRSVYLVYASAVEKDNGKGQLQLANFARDAGLYEHSARRYGYAEKADPALKADIEAGRAELRRKAADACLANARDAQAKGKDKEAQEWLALLLEKLPNEPQAAEAAAMVQAGYAREANARDDELEQKNQEALQKELKQAKQRYDSMFQRTSDGLTARNSSKSESAWRGAVDDGEAVLKELDSFAKKHAGEAELEDLAARYRQLTIEQLVEIHLHLASQYTTQTNLNGALKEANAALALDSRNPQALAARARIEQAANEGLINW